MSNEVNEKLAKIFESFNDDCVSLSDSEAETYGITIQDYAQKHPDEVLNNYLNECLKYYEELVERIQACEDFQKRIEQLSSAQPETCAYWDKESNFCTLHRPSARPEQNAGQWIPNKHTDTVLCSQCGKCYGNEYNYCPNCGADMRGDDNETLL